MLPRAYPCSRQIAIGALSFCRTVDSLEDARANLDTDVPPAVARNAWAAENMWRQIDTEFGLLSSGEVGAALGAANSNRAYAGSLRKRGEIIGIERKNAFVYPGFQIDRATGKIHTWVEPLLKLAAAHDRSASDVIMWLVGPSTMFDGARAVEHRDDTERILSAAAHAWGITW